MRARGYVISTMVTMMFVMACGKLLDQQKPKDPTGGSSSSGDSSTGTGSPSDQTKTDTTGVEKKTDTGGTPVATVPIAVMITLSANNGISLGTSKDTPIRIQATGVITVQNNDAIIRHFHTNNGSPCPHIGDIGAGMSRPCTVAAGFVNNGNDPNNATGSTSYIRGSGNVEVPLWITSKASGF